MSLPGAPSATECCQYHDELRAERYAALADAEGLVRIDFALDVLG